VLSGLISLLKLGAELLARAYESRCGCGSTSASVRLASGCAVAQAESWRDGSAPT